MWIQNLGVSLYGLAWRKERLGGDFRRCLSEFHEREHWTAERFQQHLRSEIREALLCALEGVPYYRRRWKAAGITEGQLRNLDLRELTFLPSTPKRDLRASPEDFVSEQVARRRLRHYYSSGTTGTPITAICTADGHRRFIAAREARSFAWAGTSLMRPRSMIGGRLVVPKAVSKPPFHRYNRAEKQLYFSAYHLSPSNACHYVRALNQYRPAVLTGYAYSHFLLGKFMLEQDLKLDYEPEALVLSSEKLTSEMKVVISRAFRARPYEEYGCVENCVLATECEHGRLHVSPDFGIVEIVDEKGDGVPPGVEGRILCTSLLNEAQPLVRYEIGDLGAWSPEPCPCGRNHLPVLQEVVGRIEDVVTGPDGRQMVRFHGIFVGLRHVLEGQVVQETLNSFTARIVASPEFGRSDQEEITARFRQRLGPVEVRIERVAEIPRTERGKFRAVISNLRHPEHRGQTAGEQCHAEAP